VARQQHVYRRQAVYWWRRRIPKHLRQFFSTSEIRVSLRAHMAQEAATRAARLRVITDLAFQDLERAVTTGLTLPEQTFDQLVNQLVQDELDRCERERELAGPRTEADIQQSVLDHQRRRARLQQALRTNNYADLEHEFAEVVGAVQNCASRDDLRVLQRRATRGLMRATQINERREQGIYEEEAGAVITPIAMTANAARSAPAPSSTFSVGDGGTHIADGRNPNCESRAAEPAESVAAPGNGGAHQSHSQTAKVIDLRPREGNAAGSGDDQPVAEPAKNDGGNQSGPDTRISVLMDRFIKSHAKRSMKRHYTVALRLLHETLGDPRVEDITARDLVQAIETFAYLPRTHGKGHKTANRSVHTVIAETNAEEEARIAEIDAKRNRGELDRKDYELAVAKAQIPRLSPVQAFENHLNRINKFMDWCEFQDLIPASVQARRDFISLEVQMDIENRENGKCRLPWGSRELRRLLQSKAFTGKNRKFDDPVFWAVLIAVLSGARMEEVLQLQVGDVYHEEGVLVFHFRDGYAQSIKNKSSIRKVPVHDFLFEVGLLELIQLRRDQGTEWLFAELDYGPDGRFSSRFSKQFRRYREKENLLDESRDFHSLRKDFNSFLSRVQVATHIRARLMGHTIADITNRDYDPCGEPLDKLRDVVNIIDLGLAVEWNDGVPFLREQHS
jgi:integrase